MSIVTDYLAELGPKEKVALQRLRELIYEQVPDVEDSFSYGMPTYKYKGKYMLGFAAYKNFMSIYPGAEVISVFTKELQSYKTSKGTISFTGDHPLPDELLRNIIVLSRDAINHRLTKNKTKY